MTCVHLRKLYQLCHQEGVKLGGADLIHLVCPQCGVREVCPSMLMDEYEAKEAADLRAVGGNSATGGETSETKASQSGFQA